MDQLLQLKSIIRKLIMLLIQKYLSNLAKLLVISSILNFIASSFVFSQKDINSCINFAKRLYSKGNHDAAITEFYRVAFFESDKSIKSSAFFRIGLCYRELNQWDKAIQAFQKAMYFAPNDSLLQKIKIANATTYIANGKINQAQIELLTIAHASNSIPLKREATLLLIMSAILQQDWEKTKKFTDQFSVYLKNQNVVNDFKNLLIVSLSHKKKSTQKAKWLSTFIPGSGQLYSKDYRNSLNAFLLNTVNFTATSLFLYRDQYSSAIIYFLLLTERFYSGNRYQAQQSVIKHEQKINNQFSKRLLSKIKDINSVY
ncbi:MAG: tetratricopeptide repeat protein [Candidatus Lokiarchaeota archaeon]|nr:tetratricopeptide repeat protein [Candidatus Lokiarchaeota archaeon]